MTPPKISLVFVSLLVTSLAGAYPCTHATLTCPEAFGSAPYIESAQEVCISRSFDKCSGDEVGKYATFCENSGDRCSTYTVFVGGVTRNGPEVIARGSAQVKCF